MAFLFVQPRAVTREACVIIHPVLPKGVAADFNFVSMTNIHNHRSGDHKMQADGHRPRRACYRKKDK